MGITFILLTVLSVFSILSIYFVNKFIFKKPTSFKIIFLRISSSAILAMITYIIILFLLYKLQKLEYLYLIPILIIILFTILNFILFKTKVRARNVLITILSTIILSTLYISFNNTLSGKFLFLVNKTMTPFIKVENKIQNEYIIKLKNKSNNAQEISLKILGKDITIIKPTSKIELQPNQMLKLKLLLESNPKKTKKQFIKIEAINGGITEIRETTFIYN